MDWRTPDARIALCCVYILGEGDVMNVEGMRSDWKNQDADLG